MKKPMSSSSSNSKNISLITPRLFVVHAFFHQPVLHYVHSFCFQASPDDCGRPKNVQLGLGVLCCMCVGVRSVLKGSLQISSNSTATCSSKLSVERKQHFCVSDLTAAACGDVEPFFSR
ncbi:unnamed protein product [Pylaiella littoralis]